MAISYIGKGAFVSSTADPTDPAWPTHVAGDLGIVFVETANQPISAPSGWTQIGSNQGTGTAGGANAVSIQAFYKFATGSSETAPAIPDSGNHTTAQVHTWRGVLSASPLDGTPTGGTGTGTSPTLTGLTTTYDGAHVVSVVGTDRDAASTTSFSSWTNASLASITERHDESITAGQGGGFALASGQKDAAGTVTDTTVTGPNEEYAWLQFALRTADIIVTASTTATVATGVTASASVAPVLAITIGATEWDDGATTWDSGTTLFDGVGHNVTFVAASTASSLLTVEVPNTEIEVAATQAATIAGQISATALPTFAISLSSANADVAAETTAEGTDGFALGISGNAAIASAVASAGNIVNEWTLGGSATCLIAVASTSFASMVSSVVTIWDDGATTWDSGTTIWDQTFVFLQGTATLGATLTSSGSVSIGEIHTQIAGTADIAALITAAGTSSYVFSIDATAPCVIASTLTASSSTSVLTPVYEGIGNAVIAAATTGHGAFRVIAVTPPVWYEDIQANAVTVGSHPALEIWRGSTLLWEASQVSVAGEAYVAAAISLSGLIKFDLNISCATTWDFGATTWDSGTTVWDRTYATLAAATESAGAVDFIKSIAASATATITTDSTAAGEFLSGGPEEIVATASSVLVADTTAAGETGFSIDTAIVATSSAVTDAALSATSTIVFDLETVATHTTQINAEISAAIVDIAYDITISETASALIGAAIDATGWAYIAVPAVRELSGTAHVAAATSGIGTFAYELPIELSGDAPIVVDLAATGSIFLTILYEVESDSSPIIEASTVAEGTLLTTVYLEPFEFNVEHSAPAWIAGQTAAATSTFIGMDFTVVGNSPLYIASDMGIAGGVRFGGLPLYIGNEQIIAAQIGNIPIVQIYFGDYLWP